MNIQKDPPLLFLKYSSPGRFCSIFVYYVFFIKGICSGRMVLDSFIVFLFVKGWKMYLKSSLSYKIYTYLYARLFVYVRKS